MAGCLRFLTLIQFGNMDVTFAAEAMRVARAYGNRPDIYRRLPWAALASLASPNIPEAARALIERRILDGNGSQYLM
jgi:hypothetical protein